MPLIGFYHFGCLALKAGWTVALTGHGPPQPVEVQHMSLIRRTSPRGAMAAPEAARELVAGH